MTRHFTPPAYEATAIPAMLVDTARCWREARDRGLSVQPCLSRSLAVHDCTMLAPVLDSLCLSYEGALGRPLMVGRALSLSQDELLLIDLVEGSQAHRCLDCSGSAATALECALCSTRIMLALTVGCPDGRRLS